MKRLIKSILWVLIIFDLLGCQEKSPTKRNDSAGESRTG